MHVTCAVYAQYVISYIFFVVIQTMCDLLAEIHIYMHAGMHESYLYVPVHVCTLRNGSFNIESEYTYMHIYIHTYMMCPYA
jgi:hypothetical protein